MTISSTMTNQQKQDFPVDAILGPAESLRGGKNLQDQIADAPLDAFHVPTIQWEGYATSMAQQLAYNAQGIGRIETRQAAQQELLQQIVNALSSGVDLQIDYDRIDASIKAAMPELPEYELTQKEK